jgi:hypothetical protein
MVGTKEACRRSSLQGWPRSSKFFWSDVLRQTWHGTLQLSDGRPGQLYARHNVLP